MNPFEGAKSYRYEGIDIGVPEGDSTVLRITDVENMSSIYLSLDEARRLFDWLYTNLPRGGERTTEDPSRVTSS